MKRRSVGFGSALVLAVLVLAGCVASTKFVSSWREPNFKEGSVKKVFVVGISRNTGIRHTFEDTFVAQLKGMKLGGAPSYTWFPEMDLTKVDKDATAKKLREQGFTHVLVSRLVNKQTRETYVAPTVMMTGGAAYPGYYGGWYPYMTTTYVASPGYVSSSEVYSIETNLYDLSSEGVAWTGMTETTVSGGADADIKDMIHTVVYEMRSKKVL